MQRQINNYTTYLAVEKGLSKNTLESYRRDLEKFIAFMNKHQISKPEAVDRDALNMFIADLKKLAGQPRQYPVALHQSAPSSITCCRKG